MPNGLRNDITNMSSFDKSVLILSGYGHNFIKEWSKLYTSTAIFVHEMYVTRAILYDLLFIDTDDV